MLGLIFDPGVELRIRICRKAFGLKGMNGHKYGLLKERMLARKTMKAVIPITNPEILNAETNINKNSFTILFAILNS